MTERAATQYPEGSELEKHVAGRHRRGRWFKLSFLVSLMIAVVALLTLLFEVIDSSFGLVALENEVEPGQLVSRLGREGDLVDLSKDDLVALLQDGISNNVGRRLERDQRFFDDRLVFETEAKYAEICAGAEPVAGCSAPARDQANVYQLVVERIVEPTVQEAWTLFDSVFNRAEIEQRAMVEYPQAELVFRSWLNARFLVSPQSPNPEVAGVRTAILGSLWIVAITVLFSFPVGVGAAVYLEEYAADNRLNRFIQTNINNLAGVPSIIYGMLGLAIFVRALEPFSSGALFGATEAGATANGRTVLSAGLTLGLADPADHHHQLSGSGAGRAPVASPGRDGARRHQVADHPQPCAAQCAAGILTGAILAMSRAIGETAPLVVVGASTFITIDPNGPFAKFTTLPIQIYQWTTHPQDEFRNIAAAAIVVLLIMLLTLNTTAIILRNRGARRM